MTASERIALIKRISKRLEADSWTDIDLTLRQFGLPWSQAWADANRYNYCVHHVEQGDDETLGRLGEHLFGKIEGSTFASVKDLPWTKNRFRLFLTHLAKEKGFMSKVKLKLGFKAIDGFVAHENIQPTKEWLEQIELALTSCDALAAMMTEGFHASRWTDQEVGFCVGRRTLVIPVRLGVDPYGFISRYQALTPSTKDPDIVADGIFEILCKHDLTAGRMASALVSHFADSDSFAEAKANVKLLDRVKKWTPEMLREIEQAVEKNGQIRESFGVPEAVRAIVRRHGK